MASTGAAKQTLGALFETQPNALNALRLVLAATVVVWHAHLLPGREPLVGPLEQLLKQLPVDAFFALSGFLIVRSWVRSPEPRRFLAARCLRLFPALWVCLVVTAFVVIPLALLAAGRPSADFAAQTRYVWGNVTAIDWVAHRGITDATAGLPKYAVNVSIWSLRWELACYLGVLVLGLLGWLRVRVLVATAALSWALGVSWVVLAIPDDFVFGIWPAPRLVLMFTTGALMYLCADRVPVTRGMSAVAAMVVLVGAFTPDYRLVAAPAVAYLGLVGGLWLGQFPRLRLRNDLSYGVYLHGAPIQQGLLIAGVSLSWWAFSALSLALVVPVAAGSWFLVERPALSLRRQRKPVPAAPREPRQVTV